MCEPFCFRSTVRCLCIAATMATTAALAAQRASAQDICPLPPPPEIQWCEQLQTSHCQTTNPQVELCLPRLVIIQPGGIPFIELCDCFRKSQCGAIQIEPTPIPEEFILSCPGICPPGQTCQVFVNGMPTGQPSINSNALQPGETVTCDCADGGQTGACCLPDGTCIQTTPTDCAGQFLGAGVACLGVEGCCLPDGSCVNIDLACCQAQGGTPIGTFCSGQEQAACCFQEADGTFGCVETDPACCQIVFGGTPGPAGSICEPEGACCFDANGDGVSESCLILSEICCEQIGGTFEGPDTACIGRGACCLSDGSCINIDGVCCDDLGGNFLGAGNFCLGDTDGDGVDDACEKPVFCPLPPGQDHCANLLPFQCASAKPDPNGFCFPRIVFATPSGPIVELCDCLRPDDCAAMTIEGTIARCDNACPDPDKQDCVIHLDGNPTTVTSIDTANLPIDTQVTCDCVDDPPCPFGPLITYECQAGRMDDFDTTDGSEPSDPSPALLTAMQNCSLGPITEFDIVPDNRCFGHTFEGCWPSCCDILVGATLEIRLKAGPTIPQTDGLSFREDGTSLWSMRISNLPGAGGTWVTGQMQTFILDLDNLPPDGNNTTSVLSSMLDGDLDVFVQDDTAVDYIKLTVSACPCELPDSQPFDAGNPDNFDQSDGPEPNSPSAELLTKMQNCSAGPQLFFDVPSINACFGHTFTDLPECIIGARLEMCLRAHTGLSNNDTINLEFIDPSFAWSLHVRNLPGVGGTWNAGQTACVTLDLANLPPSGSGVTNVLSALLDGDFDVFFQDDTSVDYLFLSVDVCPCVPCQCPGDINEDGTINGLDIAGFVRCLIGQPQPGDNCDCADIDRDGDHDLQDVILFVNRLLNKVPCEQCGPNDDGSACLSVVCPDPTEQCLPSCIEVSFEGGQQTVSVIDCACRNPDECHAEILSGTDPFCVGGCPDGTACVQTFIQTGSGFITCCRCDPVGACCTSNGNCVVTTAIDCENQGGQYLGDGTSCQGVQACCLSDAAGLPTCIEVDAACCEIVFGGTPGGPNSFCQPEGACCFDADGDGTNESCSVLAEVCCDQINGDFLGANTTCLGDSNGDGIDDACQPPPEVCPLHPGETFCATLQPTDCITNDPTSTECRIQSLLNLAIGVQIERCKCFDFEQCGPITFDGQTVSCIGLCPDPAVQECQIFVDGNPTGLPQAPLSALPLGKITCDCENFEPTGACCLPDGTCIQTTANDCTQQMGQYLGDNVLCGGVASCCVSGPNGLFCVEVDAACCEIVFGGIPGPAGSTCQPEGACCIDGDGDGIPETCQVVAEVCCEAVGGTFQGTNTQCLGAGACCLPDGSCVEVDRLCCDDVGGIFLGLGTMCDTDGDGIDDACDPPQELCPLPTGTSDCINHQQLDCQTADPASSQCRVRSVLVDATGLIVDHCSCFEPDECGPVEIAGDLLRCPGLCPDPDLERCEIHINGNPTGAPDINIANVPPGSKVTCDCVQQQPQQCGPPTADGLACEPLPCPGPVPPTLECLPRCVIFNDATFETRIEVCDCVPPGECFVNVQPGTVPQCAGDCPPGTQCMQTMVKISPGVFRICCQCQ